MNYGKILYYDTANGIGCRTVLFVSGCRHHCKECFNPETWDFCYGTPYTPETEKKIITSMNHPYVHGLSILGGEPFEPENQKTICSLVTTAKQLLPDKTIWMYSGYLWEELTGQKTPARNLKCRTEHTDQILQHIDILVDGEYDRTKRNIMLNFRGSENQRIIDVQKSLQNPALPPTEAAQYL